MPRRVHLTIDGRAVRVRAGATLLDAADAAGVRVPRLCHLPGRPTRAVCRLCVVALGGDEPTLVPACATPARDGLVVDASGPLPSRRRRVVMELVLAEHGAHGGGPCEVERLAAELGVERSRAAQVGRASDPGGSPYARVELDACVLCDRCVRACDRGVIERAGRGAAVRMTFRGDGSLAASPCVDCGDCLAVCPAGGLRPSEPWR